MKLFILVLLSINVIALSGQVYTTIDGKVNFVSDAPLEIIKASSDEMQGVLDLEKKRFAFKLYIRSFEGFNNALQQIHFYENYMEANEYPIATFKGKILEDIQMGSGEYRAKGILEIHGQFVERVIHVNLTIAEDKIQYTSDFVVPIMDHDITLPRIVYQKIAEKISVSISGELNRK